MGRSKKKDSIALQHLGKEILDEIRASALKIRKQAMEDGGKTILTNHEAITAIFAARRLSMPSAKAIAEYAKISRATLESLLKDAENGKTEAHKMFLAEWGFQGQILNSKLLAQDLAEAESGILPHKARNQILQRNFVEFRPNQVQVKGDINIQQNTLIQQATEIKNLSTRDLLAKVAELQEKLSPALLERAKQNIPAPQEDIIEAEIVCQS